MLLSPSSPRRPLLSLTASIAASLNSAHCAMRRNSRLTRCMREPLYFAGTSQKRLADLHAAFADPDTAAIMCIRGGYGSNYLLEALDFEIMAAHPKPFFAYSDLTGIQLRLLDELGLPVFHGPMLAADFYLPNGAHLKSFRAALAGELYSLGAN